MTVELSSLIEMMAELERRGETERIEEMRLMLRGGAKALRQPAKPSESRRDRRARERLEAKANRKAELAKIEAMRAMLSDPEVLSKIVQPLEAQRCIRP